jgi:flagella basal body P-ring formation protein FlgA
VTAACALVPATSHGAAADAAVEASVRLAIVGTVEDRVGDDVIVTVDALRVTGTIPAGPLVAVPESSARSGRPSVFALSAANPHGVRRRVGSAVATVRLEGRYVRAGRSLARGDVVEERDLVETQGALDDVPLRPLPGREAIVGARLARDVAAGDVLTDTVVRARPLVQSGDEVIVRARVGGIEAQGRAIAAQTGGPGAVIQVVNPETRRMLKGRVVARGQVEVIHESN